MKSGSFILTTLCYIRRQGKVLLLYRNKKENHGKWIGVGGKFEEGETPDECLLREVKEETGLTLTRYRLHGVVTFVSDTWDNEYMFLYSGLDFTGELRTEDSGGWDCREGRLAWIPEEEVLSLPAWEGDKYFLAPLLAGEEHIDLRLEYQGDTLVRVNHSAAAGPG